jgi:hypothetical protein
MADPAPLAVHADLALLATDGDVVTITAAESVIDVTLSRLWSLQFATGPLADRRQRQSLLVRLQRGLQVADLTLRLKVRQHVVAQLRPRSQPTRLSRLLGLGAIEVYVIPGLRALFGRNSLARSN